MSAGKPSIKKSESADSQRTKAARLYADDPDIGACDECGTDEGTRHRRVVDVVIADKPERIATWLCSECEAELDRDEQGT